MRTAHVGSIIAIAAMLGTILIAAVPAEACSLTGSPTRCVTDIYNAQKAQAAQHAGGVTAYVGVLPGAALACPDVVLVVTPPGVPGAPGLDPLQQYGANVSGDASNIQVTAPLTIFAGTGETINEAYFGAVDVVLHYDNSLTEIVLPFVPDVSDLQLGVPPTLPTLPDPNAGVQGVVDFAQGEASFGMQQANQSLACISALPQP
ncbi:MAG: hypothetical protein LC624_01485 [Halobacteriales archaeon]|nr:hypothetical protein [Halobacteriales archaeon]